MIPSYNCHSQSLRLRSPIYEASIAYQLVKELHMCIDFTDCIRIKLRRDSIQQGLQASSSSSILSAVSCSSAPKCKRIFFCGKAYRIAHPWNYPKHFQVLSSPKCLSLYRPLHPKAKERSVHELRFVSMIDCLSWTLASLPPVSIICENSVTKMQAYRILYRWFRLEFEMRY